MCRIRWPASILKVANKEPAEAPPCLRYSQYGMRKGQGQDEMTKQRRRMLTQECVVNVLRDSCFALHSPMIAQCNLAWLRPRAALAPPPASLNEFAPQCRLGYPRRAWITRTLKRAGPAILATDNGSYNVLTMATTSCNISRKCEHTCTCCHATCTTTHDRHANQAMQPWKTYCVMTPAHVLAIRCTPDRHGQC